ncbi:L-glutamate gamma-semialdehyde dehydrogenase [Oscillatoriales cyanobacterium LEGE 11467]|uniref:L-glutamate gamma-semialdehyde dehydrogenase n=1 Tax=Zarconia navalis LEGE 11467 TaxID=1828826 RepID=A0A928Z830_9CYAN|nr:L-glutamate gamma-semialdehyde dehydrogenase [Zarconia navalis]MBE9039401.1 L-glutamate gamma-semialdehyde dehydrogenase [Zarconia navalis LEGE 11467]
MVAQAPKTCPYEAKTQEIARELLAATQSKGSFFAQMRDRMQWDDKLLDWAMSNPGLRVQLFRFIDCLPALRSKAEIARHLQEYLTAEEVELPDPLKKLIGFSGGNSATGQVAATTVSTGVETLAHKYISGETMGQVIKTIERLRKDKMAFTIDLLGEAVITEAEAQSYFERYLELMSALSQQSQKWQTVAQIDEADGEPLPKVQVSVKLTAFYSQFDALDPQGSQERVSDRIRNVLRHAKKVGSAIHFDMEQYEYKDLTLSILKEILTEDEFRDRTDIGVTLQAYLRDSYADLQDLISWAKDRGNPVTVRLVKGAYWDQETITSLQNDWPQPVFNEKEATDANFERMTQLLLENHEYLYAAIGSHNVRSQAHAIAIAESLNIPQRRFEMQVLYGMGDKLATALAKRGHRVRVYCPYGELLPGMAYLIRRLLENTANSSFLRQSMEDRPVEELLAAPSLEVEDGAEVARDAAEKSAFPNVANTDYADAQLREAAQKALKQVQGELGKTYLPFIDGEYVSTSQTVNSVNPSNPEDVIGTLGLIDIELADLAIQAAKTAFGSWRRTPASERSAILRNAAEIMERRRNELVAWMLLEVGKPMRECDGEVSEAIDFCRYYADEMERLAGGHNYDLAGENNRYHYQPRGITLVISPWNFPFAIPTGMTVASLVAGNPTLLKPAEVSSVIAAKLAEILIEAGIPKGVFQFVPGKGSTVGAHMVKHRDINTIVFTGSQEVGCQIFRDAAILQPGQKHLKRVIAEMGGKNGLIIDESADLDQAVAGVVQSAFGYSGQKCSACSRAIAIESVYDAFVSRLVEAVRSLNVGDAAKPSTQVGPVIDAKAQQRIREYIAKGKEESSVAIEMPSPEPGYFVGPVVFADVKPDDTIAQEEIFGPVLAVIKVKDFDAALEVANGTNYALTGGLYSRTPSHIDRAMAEFEVGNLYINRGITGAIVSRQPFGGFKLSGVGSKAGGPDYVLQFLEPRTITENIQRQGFAPIEGTE